MSPRRRLLRCSSLVFDKGKICRYRSHNLCNSCFFMWKYPAKKINNKKHVVNINHFYENENVS